ncbi:putative toxin-antitoxin system, toxin component [Limosilactobacillus antri DSM 16041]|nr:putative toxin-antitoxin system, toxin component [Limosilactobacillus antri DSM 16041]
MGRISMDKLISYLINYGFDHGISSTLTYELPPDFPSSASSKYKKALINMNWHNKWEVPFSFAHELGHIINGDDGINYYHSFTVHSKTEFEANKTAIDIILAYCRDNDIPTDNSNTLCEQFGIPFKLEYIVALKLKNIM